MKKVLALVLCLSLCLGLVSSALAENRPISYEYPGRYAIYTDSTDDFMPGSAVDYINRNGLPWKLSMTSGYISPTHRLVMRVYSNGKEASSLWVYENDSGKTHPYKTKYAGGGYPVAVYGRLDDRDSGVLNIAGNFYYWYIE